MAKYLHRYKSREDFEKDYYGSTPVTAITISGGSVNPGCEGGDWSETHDFDGKYVFVEETTLASTGACNSRTYTTQMRLFRRGDIVLYDQYLDIQKAWLSEVEGMVFYIQDLSQARQAGDAELYVSNLEYGEAAYHEPWVSCTTDTEMLSATADALYENSSLQGTNNVLIGTNITLTSMGRTGFYVDLSDTLV